MIHNQPKWGNGGLVPANIGDFATEQWM